LLCTSTMSTWTTPTPLTHDSISSLIRQAHLTVPTIRY